MSWGRGTVYVTHCLKCNRLVKLDDRNNNEDLGCPDPLPSKPLDNGAPMVSFGSHKQDRNYPQVAPNLPGDGIVTSWNDYEKKLAKSGQGIIGTSTESRQRSKALKRKPTNEKIHPDYKV